MLCIDKTSQTLRWVVDGKVLKTVDVRFGASYTPTREGVFRVYLKSRDHVSQLYDSAMPFAMFFSGGQAVHYSSDFAARGYSGASHGCVNVRDYDAVAWLYDQVQVGDKVVVYWSLSSTATGGRRTSLPESGRGARAWVRLDPRDERPDRPDVSAETPEAGAPGGPHRRARAPGEASLIDLLPEDHPVTWLRRGDGLVGCGVAAEIRTSGRGPVRRGQRVVARAHRARHRPQRRRRAGQRPGRRSAPSRSPTSPGDSTSRRPRGDPRPPRRHGLADHRLLGRRPRPARPPARAGHHPAGAGRRQLHRRRPQRRAVDGPASPRRSAGSTPATSRRWCSPATWSPPPPSRSTCAGRCAGWPSSYPTCWTFHVDGMFGATPELLVRRERGLVTSRVLAGTIRRTGDDARDLALAARLARSSKDLEEHEYAVRSVAEALEPHCSSMNVPEAPFVLHLPNVMHLATDVAGVVHDSATVTSLELAAALHPSAAVGGTPTAVATELIARARGDGPRPLRRPGRLDGRRRRRRVGHRAALGRDRRATPSGSSPAAASSPTPTPRPSWPRPRASSSPSGTRSPARGRVSVRA